MGKEDTAREFAGARVVFGDVTSPASIDADAFDQPADVVVCCLASRTGAPRRARPRAPVLRRCGAPARGARAAAVAAGAAAFGGPVQSPRLRVFGGGLTHTLARATQHTPNHTHSLA